MVSTGFAKPFRFSLIDMRGAKATPLLALFAVEAECRVDNIVSPPQSNQLREGEFIPVHRWYFFPYSICLLVFWPVFRKRLMLEKVNSDNILRERTNAS